MITVLDTETSIFILTAETLAHFIDRSGWAERRIQPKMQKCVALTGTASDSKPISHPRKWERTLLRVVAIVAWGLNLQPGWTQSRLETDPTGLAVTDHLDWVSRPLDWADWGGLG